jgi:N-acyl-D-amino-acid deacylase
MKKTITRRSFLKKSSKIVAATGLGGCGILLKGCALKKEFDLIIRGGFILDGSGGEAFEADIGISGNSIKEIGQILSVRGESVIEAKDLVVCPGFIDTHDHTSVELLVNPRAESSIRQGITTLVSGNCGSSPFPVAEETYEEEKENLKELYQLDLNWRDINGFFSRLEEKGMALNYSTFVGQGSIRGAAMGFNDRPPSQEELEKMKKMVEENIRWGAIGLSSGLEYAPGSYAKADEIYELCKVAAQNGGVYATHMRDEGDQLIESLDETIEVARKTGVSLEISHFKIANPRNWSKIDAALAKVEEAKKEGISIFCDRYPYIAGSTGLSYYFPLWAKQGTTDEFLARLKDPAQEARLRAHLAKQERKIISWNKVVISSVVSEKNKIFEGKSVQEGAKETGKKPYDFMKDLLIEERNRVGMVTFMMKEKNLKRILAHPLVGVGTDGSAVAPYGLLHRGKPHPRHYGTFPRVLGKYVREDKIVPLPEMLKKITSVPAQKFGFGKRGTLKSGYFADIVIFDKDKVIDKATWTDPHQYSEGIEYVLVNGSVVIKEGEHTGDLPGKVLRKETV